LLGVLGTGPCHFPYATALASSRRPGCKSHIPYGTYAIKTKQFLVLNSATNVCFQVCFEVTIVLVLIMRAGLRSSGTPSCVASPPPTTVTSKGRPSKPRQSPEPSPAASRTLRSNSLTSTPPNSLASPHCSDNPMAGVKRTLDAIHESEAEDSESDESTSTHEQSLVINTRTDALIVLKKALAKAPSAELEAFKEFFVSCEFMNAFDDYSAVWEYTHFLSWLVDKKLSDANKNINKARLHKTPVKVGDKFTFSVDSHVVAVCVPCFEAGRTPQRCLFTGLSGFCWDAHRVLCNRP